MSGCFWCVGKVCVVCLGGRKRGGDIKHESASFEEWGLRRGPTLGGDVICALLMMCEYFKEEDIRGRRGCE